MGESNRPGVFPGIHITAEKSHNKNINKITGLDSYGIDLDKLSTKFQTQFACSVSLHELPGKTEARVITSL